MDRLPPIVVDTREQRPWTFANDSIVATVPTGADYSLLGWEHAIGLERKNLDDLVGSLTTGRERFMRSLAALRERPFRALVVEADLSTIIAGDFRSRMNPSSLLGSLASIMSRGIPVVFASDHQSAGIFAERLLAKFYARCLEAQEQEDRCESP
jgi:ERCC4-type nuclease